MSSASGTAVKGALSGAVASAQIAATINRHPKTLRPPRGCGLRRLELYRVPGDLDIAFKAGLKAKTWSATRADP